MPRCLLFALVSQLLCVAACAPEEAVGGQSEAIASGTRETGYNQVVAVVRVDRSGAIVGICSGTAITARHVLTAKHCLYAGQPDGSYAAVDVSRFRVLPGNDIRRPLSSHVVAQIVTTPGDYEPSQLWMGQDIAVLRTATDHGAPTREIARAQPRVGNEIVIVGFGRTSSAAGTSGRKHSGRSRVQGEAGGLFYARGPSWVCKGDSGGPAIDLAGRVLGIASFRVEEGCTDPDGFYTQVAPHMALIESAIGTAACTVREEICNGADDDCDGIVDDGCRELGESCAGDSACASGRCGVVDGAWACVQDCSPASEAPSCPSGYICRVTGCDVGTCVLGTPGAGVADAACSDDLDCASSYCFDDGRGAPRCARQCEEGGEACGAGRVCVTDGYPCGACTAPTPGDPLPFASDCTDGTECFGRMCRLGACTRACTVDAACPTDHRCSGDVCVFGAPSPAGGTCADALECEEAAPSCTDVDGDLICVAECPAGSCPDDQICTEGLCLPSGLALGASCEANAECRTGICAGTCTRVCLSDSECPQAFSCGPAGEVSGCFPNRQAAPSSPGGMVGGCTAAALRPPADPSMFAFATLVVLLFEARRRRRAHRGQDTIE